MGLWSRLLNIKAREKRLCLYLIVVLGVAAWKYAPRPWHPTYTIETTRHIAYSSATREQTEATLQALESLYTAYSNRFEMLPSFQSPHPKLKLKLFKDRGEMRRINPGLGWAEAYYREPYCRAYFAANEPNPYHWMLHESVHQLNHEVAHVHLEKLLEEGLADYFATSQLETNRLAVGKIDPNTYPVWWLDTLATSSNLAENVRNGSVIPLKAIITNRGGPRLNSHFNLYYLHWWTLTHFIFEDPRYRDHAVDLVKTGGTLGAFEKLIGPVEQIETAWHAHVQELKKQPYNFLHPASNAASSKAN
jgi:hypothetical protein